MKSAVLFISTVFFWQVYTTQYDLNEAEKLFENFIQTYSKQYTDVQERKTRFEIFKQNLKSIIHDDNKNSAKGEAEFGITKFSDLTKEEFSKLYTGLEYADDYCDIIKTDDDIPDAKAPKYLDWRDKKVVTSVKNQAQCLSSWAFSAIGNVESQYALKYNTLVEFSEQQLIDCGDESKGCGPGLMTQAFRYLINAGGAETEEDYPYVAEAGTCNFNDDKVEARVSDCITYNLTSQNTVKKLLYKTGPISIAIQGDNLRNYKQGILSARSCDSGNIDLGVLLVGYGSDQGLDYWIVKPSFGKDFGEKGYFRMERTEGVNTCKFLNDGMASVVID